MQPITVYDRERHESRGKPYTFDGDLLAEHTSTADERQISYTAVYRRDDGQFIIEFRQNSLLVNNPAGDVYIVVERQQLRSMLLMLAPKGSAIAIGQKLGLDISEADYA